MSTVYQIMQSYTVESFNLVFTAVRTSELTLIVIIGNSRSVSGTVIFVFDFSIFIMSDSVKHKA